ncbi:hypothetical protein Ocin01_14011 [Orchesella cincta]|uniref:Uncharacterized protein n=1 Tax=Orchesella cincta TaxID=48709 RepID=A0A1D2MID2_ORCCI|nr:hypothetical protein Ocin01_14011 [Orchesella cincta]
MKSSTTILCGIALSCVLFSLTNGAAVVYKEEHDTFFRSLPQDEREILMALAIAHHDTPSHGESGTMPISPLVRPTAEKIPSRLFKAMINGDVPENWQTGFIEWLKADYGITDESLNQYRRNETDDVCQEGGRCFKLNDLGAQCCPFG